MCRLQLVTVICCALVAAWTVDSASFSSSDLSDGDLAPLQPSSLLELRRGSVSRQFDNGQYCPVDSSNKPIEDMEVIRQRQLDGKPLCTKSCCALGTGNDKFVCVDACKDGQYRVCTRHSECEGIAYGGKTINGKCCHYWRSNAPGLCVDDCSADYEVTGRCDTNADCPSDAPMCCEEKSGDNNFRGYCRRQCKSKDQASFGCGAMSSCVFKLGRHPKGLDVAKKAYCCQDTRVFSEVTRSCSNSPCGAGFVDVTGKPFDQLVPGLARSPPGSLTDMNTLSWRLNRVSELISRAVSNQKEMAEVLELKKKKTIKESCDYIDEHVKPLADHIFNTMLLPMSVYLLREVIGSTDAHFAEFTNARLTEQLGLLTNNNDQGFRTGVDKIAALLEATARKGAFDIKADWYKNHLALVEPAAAQVVARCKAYAQHTLTVFGQTPPTDDDQLFISAFGLVKKTALTARELSEKKALYAFQGAKLCFGLWDRVLFGVFYLRNVVNVLASGSTSFRNAGSGTLKTAGNIASPFTFGISGVVTTGIGAAVDYFGKSSDEKKKAFGGFFFDFIQERMKKSAFEGRRQCFAARVSADDFCRADKYAFRINSDVCVRACKAFITTASPTTTQGVRDCVPDLIDKLDKLNSPALDKEMPEQCDWNGLFNSQWTSITNLYKDVSALRVCGKGLPASDDGVKRLDSSVFGLDDAAQAKLQKWDVLIAEDSGWQQALADGLTVVNTFASPVSNMASKL